MRLEPKEEDRARLGELYLSGELLARDMAEMMRRQLTHQAEFAAKVRDVALVPPDRVRPIMDGYRLIALEVDMEEDNAVS